jgi:hypothetical protein
VSVEWGSVADWAAAVGGFGALIYAVRLGAGASKDARRRQADAVAVWTDPSFGAGARTVNVTNASALPITALQLRAWAVDANGLAIPMVVVVPGSVGSNETKQLQHPRADMRPGEHRTVVQFTDAAGRRWSRGVDGLLEEFRPQAARRRWYAPWRR